MPVLVFMKERGRCQTGGKPFFYRPFCPSALFRNKGARCGLMASARVSFSPAAGADLRETHNNLLKSACVCLSVVINSFLKSFLNSLCGGFWGILSRRRFWVGIQCAVSRFVVLALAVPLPEI